MNKTSSLCISGILTGGLCSLATKTAQNYILKIEFARWVSSYSADILYFTALSFLSYILFVLFGKKKYISILWSVLVLCLSNLNSILSIVGLVYLAKTEMFVQWSYVFEFWEERDSGLVRSYTKPCFTGVYIYTGLNIFVYLSLAAAGIYRRRRLLKTNAETNPGRKRAHASAVLVLIGLVFLGLVTGMFGSLENKGEEGRNETVAFTRAFFAYLSPPVAGKHGDGTKLVSDKKPLGKKTHNPDGVATPPQNVVLIFLESTRSDILPMDYNSTFAKQYLTSQAQRERTITPFFDRLAKESFYAPNTRTTSTYTNKLIASVISGRYPIFKNTSVEAGCKRKHPTLLEILKKKNFRSAFFQTSDGNWDKQREMTVNSGFDLFVDRHQIDNGEVRPSGTPEIINYMGYDDNNMIGPIMEWVDRREKEEAPFFLSYVTNVSHGPHTTPKSWRKRNLSPDEDVNKFLNSKACEDDFIQNLMSEFKKKKSFEKTLFVFIGDHGISLKDQDSTRWGVHGVSNEKTFWVPVFIQSENEWVKSVLPRARTEEVCSALDIFPTVIDLLSGGSDEEMEKIHFKYEGYSLLRKLPDDRPFLGVTNPGGHSLVLYQKDKKAVLKENGEKEFYDLKTDPFEQNTIKSPAKNKNLRGWAKDADRLIRQYHATTRWFYTGWQ